MPNFLPLSATRHAGKFWQARHDYRFASSQSVIVITSAEVMRAAIVYPIAFQIRADKVFPIVLLGLRADCNLMVSPDGSWLGAYIPAVLRAYPFQLRTVEGGKQVLCIDDEALQLSDDPEGKPLFDAEGKPSPAVEEVLQFLSLTRKSRQIAIHACAALHEHGVLKPWPVDDAGSIALSDLWQIDEQLLSRLGGDSLIKLRDTGALTLAYSQLISMQNLSILKKMDESRQKVGVSSATLTATTSMLEAMSEGGTLSFNGF